MASPGSISGHHLLNAITSSPQRASRMLFGPLYERGLTPLLSGSPFLKPFLHQQLSTAKSKPKPFEILIL